MKQKLELSEKWQSVWNNALWFTMLFAFVFMCNTQPSHASALEDATVTELPKHKYKNDNVRKYHKANNKRFVCSACPKKRFLGIFKKSH